MKKHLINLLTGCLLSQPLWAAEVDSFTVHKLELPDALQQINTIFNARLAEGVAKANERDLSVIGNLGGIRYCNEATLYTELRKSIFQSFTASLGLKGYDLDLQLREALQGYSYVLSLNDSVYRDLNYLEAFSLNLKELSHLVNVNGYLIGLDKIGHLFAQGWQYFEHTAEENQSLEYALNRGKEQEQGKYGYATTGIFSFADLTANLNGWRFWNQVLLNDKDPLKNAVENFFTRSYVTCKVQILESIKQGTIVRAWSYRRAFDFSDYIDGAWDEANNCNSYKSPIIENKIKSRLKDVNPGYSCPLEPDACMKARGKYGPYATHVLHPFCLISG